MGVDNRCGVMCRRREAQYGYLPLHATASADGCVFIAQASQVTWFMVRSRRGALLPHNVRIEEGKRAGAPGAAETECWREVVDMVAPDATRMDLAQPWRPCSSIASGIPEGPPLSRVRTPTGSLEGAPNHHMMN